MNTVNLELIRTRRKELRIPLQEMAEYLGYKNASTYLKYEKGVYKFDADQVPLIAKKLRMTVNQIFFTNSLAKIANM